MKKGSANISTVVSESKQGPALSVLQTPPHKEEVDWKLHEAREQLLTLRQQQDELERQKSDLEELRRKQDEYARGKVEMIDQLTRGLSILEREQIQAQRLAEACTKTSEAFHDYLERLKMINDQEWTSANVRSELSSSLALIENSRLEYNRARTKLDCLNPGFNENQMDVAKSTKESSGWSEMLHYLKLGAAASAPLIVAGTIWLIALVFLAR